MTNNLTAVKKRKIETAYHEAGHAVAYILTFKKFKYITIKPDKDTLGHLRPSSREFTPDRFNIEKLHSLSFRCLSGAIAESIFTGRKIYISGGDYDILSNYLVRYMDEKTSLLYGKFIWAYCYSWLKNPIWWKLTEKIASELLARETLTYDEVQEINKNIIFEK